MSGNIDNLSYSFNEKCQVYDYYNSFCLFKSLKKLKNDKTLQTYEGRDRCRELIEELQSTHALEQQDEQECSDEKIRMIELQRVQNEKSMQEDRLCEVLDSLEGKTICGTLDFFSKVNDKFYAFLLLFII